MQSTQQMKLYQEWSYIEEFLEKKPGKFGE